MAAVPPQSAMLKDVVAPCYVIKLRLQLKYIHSYFSTRFNTKRIPVMLVLQSGFSNVLLSSHLSSAVCAYSRSSRCRCILSGLCAAFHRIDPPAVVRTRFLTRRGRWGCHRLNTADRNKEAVTCCRGFSTTENSSSDALGKIQSTHYQLVYTCQVSSQCGEHQHG